MLVVNLPPSPQALPPQILSDITATQNRKNCSYLLFLLLFFFFSLLLVTVYPLIQEQYQHVKQQTTFAPLHAPQLNHKLFCVKVFSLRVSVKRIVAPESELRTENRKEKSYKQFLQTNKPKINWGKLINHFKVCCSFFVLLLNIFKVLLK